MTTQAPSEPETSGNLREFADLSEILDIDSMEILTILDSFSQKESSDLRSFLNFFNQNQGLAMSLINGYREAGMDSITACLQVGRDCNYRARVLQQSESKLFKKLRQAVSSLLSRFPIE